MIDYWVEDFKRFPELGDLENYSSSYDKYAKGLVLDCGCGLGGFSIRFSRVSEDVVSLDSSLFALNYLKDHKPENVHLVLADCNYLPFRENIFDTIFSLYLIEHLKFPEKVLVFLYHLLKYCGVLVLSTDTNLFMFAHVLKEIKFFKFWKIPETLAYLRIRHISIMKPKHWEFFLQKLFNGVDKFHLNPLSHFSKRFPRWVKCFPEFLSIGVMFVCRKIQLS